MTERSEAQYQETRVQHVAHPRGGTRENPPHLADLREFVTACEGLPDDLRVDIYTGALDDGGRNNVTFSVLQRVIMEAPRA